MSYIYSLTKPQKLRTGMTKFEKTKKLGTV